MYMAVIAALAAISSLLLARRSPAFSTSYVLRLMVFVGVAAGSMILAVPLTIHWTQHGPQTLQLTAILTLVGVATFAMIALSFRLFLPSAAPLPPAAKRLDVFQKRTAIWGQRLLWVLGAFGLSLVVLQGTARIVVGSVGGLLVYVAVMLLFTAWLAARKTDSWLSAVEASPWVHWRYSPEQWRRWTDAMSRQTGSRSIQRALAKADPEVYFGQIGLFALGEFTPWATVGVYLVAAAVDGQQPQSITFKFEKLVPGYATAQVETKEVTLPVPDGSAVAGDLNHLQQQLSACCPKARIALASPATYGSQTNE